MFTIVNYFCLLAAALSAFGQSPVDRQRASIAIQLQSVRKQAATAAVWLMPWGPPPRVADPACDPLPDVVVTPLIESAAKARQIDPKLLRFVMEQESGIRPCAVSTKGAQGLMQLMPATIDEFHVVDPFDPKQSVEAGAQLLKQLLDRYKGDLPEALGAYNAGASAVDQAGGVPDIPETRSYVDAILGKMGTTRTVPPQTPKPKPIGN